MAELSKMTLWRQGVARARGSERLVRAMDGGVVSIMAAFRAARYLSPREQDAALDAMTSPEQFSRTMAQVAREHEGRTIKADLSEEEWSLVKEERSRRGRS